MASKVIDSKMLANCFIAGAKNLEKNKEIINELNVFPVPDGDTGTNMSMTIMATASEVSALVDPDMETLCKAVSSGSLRGARGNSGVILSQLLRGFTKVIRDYDELDIAIISAGFDKAVETAYKAVMKPKEGTILTVAKGISEKANELFEEGEEDMDVFISSVLEYGDKVLSQTPELLPVLKEAGVVDSGGSGLMAFLKGAYEAYQGKEIDYTISNLPVKPLVTGEKTLNAEADIKYGYCTEFIILLNGKKFDDSMEAKFKEYLLSIGDSLVVVADDELVKVHVHTNDPGLAIQKALTYGELSNMKIDNMRLEHHEKVIKQSEMQGNDKSQSAIVNDKKEKYGIVSISSGKGLAEIFTNLGVNECIDGGQTMNPSTEDILNSVYKVNAETVYILPNNKNIILAASQVNNLAEGVNVIVIPSKTITQGISAMIGFSKEASPEENEAAMLDCMSTVKSGQITYAVRNTTIEGRNINEGDYMGIGDNGIVANGDDIKECLKNLIMSMKNEESELLSVYYGQDVDNAAAEDMEVYLKNEFSDIELDFHEGGQPVYYYIVSVE